MLRLLTILSRGARRGQRDRALPCNPRSCAAPLAIALLAGCAGGSAGRTAPQADDGAEKRVSASPLEAISGSVSTPVLVGPSVTDPADGRARPEVEPSAAGAAAKSVAVDDKPADVGGRTACQAFSLEITQEIDARSQESITRCQPLRTGQELSARDCGVGAVRTPLDMARLEAAVLAFDDATRTHVQDLTRRGRAAGRDPRVFGLVGDSITAGAFFFNAFGEGSEFVYDLSPEARRALRTGPRDGEHTLTIIDHYRGVRAEQRVGGFSYDSFRAERAAKVGARSDWAVLYDDIDSSPVARMVKHLSPSVAVVMFGTNDAVARIEAIPRVQRAFEESMGRVINALERRGVVPILSTIPRHGMQKDRPSCDRHESDTSDWRIAVQTNAVNASVVKLACERHLPLVDLRYAMDGLVNHGLGRDGVHPTGYRGGAGKLTEDGLQCGYNVRNFVTLLMLKQVKELTESAP